MKKALALVLALVLALSMAVSAFAANVDLVVLGKADATASDKVEIEVVDFEKETLILYTTAGIDPESVNFTYGTEYYIALEDKEWKNVEVTANGNATAELVKYDPATMDIIGLDVVFNVVDREGNVANYFSAETDNLETDYAAYKAAVDKADERNEGLRILEYSVEVATNVNIIKVTVEDNFTAHYTEGTLKVTADLYDAAKKKDVAYVGTATIINDVCIFEYEEVKYAAEKNADGETLQLGWGGYSDYWTSELGYNYDTIPGYDEELLRELPGALVVSTTAFRAIEGKDLTLDICPAYDLDDDDVEDVAINVTLKDIEAGQKGINFFAWVGTEGMEFDVDELEFVDRYPSAITFGFLGDQVVKGEFEIEILLPINWYELRELFGLKVEEDDIISYYLIDENGKVVGGKEIDYMTADITELVEFSITGKNQKLGEYKLVLEVPAAEEGEANPNTGAESVVGVVAALAVVSVATAAAVSLKK
ncbi:MAG: hypothetical protein E7482_06295 [Ruminococcaceae bacterium]|nr:hypothetical protein [Oscillospiraceae bacterium]